MQTVGHITRERRRQLGRTLAELAEQVDCSKAYLSAIENEKVANPPSDAVIDRLEAALDITQGQLRQVADWWRTPTHVRAQMDDLQRRSRTLAAWLRQSSGDSDQPGRNLDALYASGALQQAIESHGGNIDALVGVCYQVPLINRVAAGYPSEFTDLDYPARVADEYVAVPGVSDSQAFAARVVGSSMEPTYQQGDVIVFSPARAPMDGDDCFVRLLPDHHTTFKRVFFEDDQCVRLQPLNPKFAAKQVGLHELSGLYPAVYRLQQLKAG